MDVVAAFLNGKMDEEIYVEQPDGYVVPRKENLVCKLKKSLLGLKQSPPCWYSAFREYVESTEFKQSDADPCVYVRTVGSMTIVAVYVDDLILITATEDEMKKVKESEGKLSNSIQNDGYTKTTLLSWNQYFTG